MLWHDIVRFLLEKKIPQAQIVLEPDHSGGVNLNT